MTRDSTNEAEEFFRHDSCLDVLHHETEEHREAPSSVTSFTLDNESENAIVDQSQVSRDEECQQQSGTKTNPLAPVYVEIAQGPTLPDCPSSSSIYFNRRNWRSICNILVSIYSTVFSGIWLVIAIVRPRYGRIIHPGGSFAPSTASAIFALLAKTIEIASVTVFVTILGQILTRRSLALRGFTIADIAMRVWIIQPGYIFTHWPNVKIVGATVLGVTSLLGSLAILLFTTASSTLVSPHLSYGHWHSTALFGLVQGLFATVPFIQGNCQTPITYVSDPYSSETCLDLSFTDLSSHDFGIYLQLWATIVESGEGAPQDLSSRPQAVSSVFSDGIFQGSWVQTRYSNLTANYETFGRIVNNVTLSMPHAGIYYASQDAINGILQPVDGSGLGEYAIQASVVSPTTNVLCVNLNESELAPLVYTTWPNARYSTTDIPGQRVPAVNGNELYALGDDVQPVPGNLYFNSTTVDDLFEWGFRYGRQPPVFPMFPINYNSVVNVTVSESDSIYILFKAPTTVDYTVCQLRAFLSPSCSTRYNVTIAGHSMMSHCEDEHDSTRYEVSVPGAPYTRSLDYRDVLSQWASAMELNMGMDNLNLSIGRTLTQLVPNVPSSGQVTLNPLLPSLAESLSVLSCSMLMKSSINTTFYHYWNYTATILEPGVYIPFNVTLRTEQYGSGAVLGWQGMFYPVLVIMFAGNAFCLVYFTKSLRMSLVSDITDPQNSFALAINSPYSSELIGSCGTGPQKEQLVVGWHLKKDEKEHYYLKAGKDDKYRGLRKRNSWDSIELLNMQG